MPEPQAATGFGQHADGTCLADHRDQVRHAAPKHDGQIRDREFRAEQGRRPQDLAHRSGHEPEAVRYGRRQELGTEPLVSAAAPTSVSVKPELRASGDGLGDVERVACRPVGESQQVAVEPAARQVAMRSATTASVSAVTGAGRPRPPLAAAQAGHPAGVPGAFSRLAAALAAPTSPAVPTR
jgi:hypothetical protein